MNLFYVRILDGFKLILVGTMTSYGTVPAARWDEATSKVLNHKAFQPFRWPMMSNEASTWVDVKVKVEGDLLLHLSSVDTARTKTCRSSSTTSTM